jgi:hypothetical protein
VFALNDGDGRFRVASGVQPDVDAFIGTVRLRLGLEAGLPKKRLDKGLEAAPLDDVKDLRAPARRCLPWSVKRGLHPRSSRQFCRGAVNGWWRAVSVPRSRVAAARCLRLDSCRATTSHPQEDAARDKHQQADGDDSGECSVKEHWADNKCAAQQHQLDCGLGSSLSSAGFSFRLTCHVATVPQSGRRTGTHEYPFKGSAWVTSCPLAVCREAE